MAELKLRVSLDTSYLKGQISRLPLEFAGANVSIRPKFDRETIVKEFAALNRYISSKKFNIVINTNLETEIKNADRLVKALGRVQQAASGAKGGLPIGTQRLSRTKGEGGFAAAEIKALFGAAMQGGLIDEKTLATTRAQMVTALGSIGRDSIAGLLNGLKSGDADIQNAAKFLGNNLITSFKTVLGIASPSREFKKIGESAGQGFEQGLLKSIEIAEQSATRKMQRMLDRLARMALIMGGISGPEIGRQVAQSRALPSLNFGATTPRTSVAIGPSSTGRALPPGVSRPELPGTAFGRQKYLPTALGEELKEVLRGAANAFLDSIRQNIRAVTITDMGKAPSRQGLLQGSSVAGFLPGRASAASVLELNNILAGAIREYFKSVARDLERKGKVSLSTTPLLPSASRRNPPLLPPIGGTSGSIRISTGAYVGQPSMMRAPSIPPSMGGGGGAPPVPPRGGGGGGSFGGMQFNVPNLPGAGLVREIGTEFGFAAKQVLLFGTAYKALAFIQGFPAQVGDAVGALQSFRNTLGAISPSAEEAAESSQFILDIVDKYNTPIQSARDGFTKLYASMKPTGFSGDEIRDLFLGISQAAATFGMSAEKVDRVNYAFAQMASKGQVMSEELKGQLGDVLPGAMGIFAEAAGFTGPDAITKFSKALEDGAYKGAAMKTLLTNVGIVMRKEFGPGAEGAARTFQGVINRMQNSFKLLYESFEPVAVGFLNSVVMPLTSGIKTLTDGFNAFFTDTLAKTEGGAAFAQQLNNLKPSFEGIRANLAALIPSFQTFGQLLLSVTQFLVTLAGNPIVGFLLKVYTNILLVNTAFTLLGGKILLGLIANIGAAIARLVTFNATMNALAIASGRAGTSVAGTALQMQFLQARAASAAGPVAALLGSLLSMAAIGAIAIAVTIVVNGLTEMREAEARLARLRGEKDPVGPSGPRPVATAASRYVGATKEKVTADQQKQQDFVTDLRATQT
jgi:tape measure domain-containing protein